MKVEQYGCFKYVMYFGGAQLRTDSVLRPKNAQNSTLNGKNHLLLKKFSNFSIDQFSSFYGKNNFFSSKTSSDRLKNQHTR
jgi:rare lipoprotein A (peptidoglycan hydrolase)